MANKKGIFRSKTSSLFDKEQGPLALISLPTWLILFSCAFALMVLLIWSVFGTVYTRVYGTGVLLPGDAHIYPATSYYSGVIQQILVNRGDIVEKGQVVAIVDTTELDKKISNQERYINRLEEEQNKILSKIANQKQALADYQEHLIAALKQKKDFSTQYKQYLTRFIAGVDGMQKKGYMALPKFEQYKDQYYQAANSIQETIMNMAKSEYSREQAEYALFEKLSNTQLQLLKQQNELIVLKEQRTQTQEVRAQKPGQVIAVMAAVGNYLQAGQSVINIASHSNEYQLFTLFSPHEGKRIKDKMAVLASPTYVDKYRYGSINGEVESINQYPANKNAIMAVILDSAWLDSLGFKDKSMLMAKIKLKNNKNSLTGFDWTSSNGPPISITPGSFMKVSVAVRRQAPITLLIPLLRQMVGMEA